MAETKAAVAKNAVPPTGTQWAPGAEPLAICMSCSSTHPQELTECPNCHVGLSIVRKCPSCGRVQSAQHIACIYCANSFIREQGLAPLKSGPLLQRRQAAEKRLRVAVGIALAVLIAAGAALFLTRKTWRSAPPTLGQTYALEAISMRSEAATNAPPVKDLEPSAILDITGSTIDAMGNRWFQVMSADVTGYVQIEDVAPPRVRNSEKGFEVLRYSMFGISRPDTLSLANKAVDYYCNSFPASPHNDELRWLLAERTREIAGRHSGHHRALLANMREQYQKIAQGGGEYSERARQALAELSESSSAPGPASDEPAPALASENLSFAGSTGSTGISRGSARLNAPVRRIAEVSKTPLWIRIPRSVDVSPGSRFQGEFAQDIRVNKEIAIPRGSSATMSLMGGDGSRRLVDLRLIAANIEGETYQVSATAVRIQTPGNNGRTLQQRLPSTLPAGTQLEFQLEAPLVVRQR